MTRRLAFLLGLFVTVTLILSSPDRSLLLAGSAPAESEASKQVRNVPLLAARGGKPWINLGAWKNLLGPDSGLEQSSEVRTLSLEAASLAAGDFDANGAYDLVVGYGSDGKGVLAVFRGNIDAVFPNSAGAYRRREEGTFTENPFPEPPRLIRVPLVPQLVAVGDFDADERQDVVLASRSGDLLFWLRGDGGGGFDEGTEVRLPGLLTAMTVGDVNRRDGLADLLLGVEGLDQDYVMIFRSPKGALMEPPVNLPVASAPEHLVVAQLNQDYPIDFAMALENDVWIVRGWDASPTEFSAVLSPEQMDQYSFESRIVSLAAGEFSGSDRHDLGVLLEDGWIHLLEQDQDRLHEAQAVDSGLWYRSALGSEDGTNRASTLPRLLRSRVSATPRDDLVVFVPGAGKFSVVIPQLPLRTANVDADGKESLTPLVASLGSVAEVVAVLPVRLNEDALDDLVILGRQPGFLGFVVSEPNHVFVVDNSGAASDTNPKDGDCLIEHNTEGNCTLWAALESAEALPGLDKIVFCLTKNWHPENSLECYYPPRQVSWQSGKSMTVEDDLILDGRLLPTYEGDPSWRIHLDSTWAGSTTEGLVISASNSTIRSVRVGPFKDAAVVIKGTNNQIQDSRIGVGGLRIENSDNTVGLAEDKTADAGQDTENGIANGDGTGIWVSSGLRNRICGNSIGGNGSNIFAQVENGHGVMLGEASEETTVCENGLNGNRHYGVLVRGQNQLIQGNTIGYKDDKGNSQGNFLGGVLVEGDATTVLENQVAFNGRTLETPSGIAVALTATGTRISRNRIFSNDGPGIDIGLDGRTENDPEDDIPDYPELADGPMGPELQLHSFPRSDFLIEFFSNESCDPSGYGEGSTYAAGRDLHVTTNHEGKVSFDYPSLRNWSTTATVLRSPEGVHDPGVTSEFSECTITDLPTCPESSGPKQDAGAVQDCGSIVVNTIADPIHSSGRGLDPDAKECYTGSTFMRNDNEVKECSLRAAIEWANKFSGSFTVSFDIPDVSGTPTIEPSKNLPEITSPITIDGTDQISGLVEVNGSQLSSGTTSWTGLVNKASGSNFKGLRIRGFSSGLVLDGGEGNIVQRCSIRDNDIGVFVWNSSENLIGGLLRADHSNTIADNGNGDDLEKDELRCGIFIGGETSSQNRIWGNTLEGNYAGVCLNSKRNWVGGDEEGAGNLISANNIGVWVTSPENNVQGNVIGLKLECLDSRHLICKSPAHRNGNDFGVLVESDRNLIGGVTAGARNWISANPVGIKILRGTENKIQGNSIGPGLTELVLDKTGNVLGILIEEADNNLVGGPVLAIGVEPGNVISGNQGAGVQIQNSARTRIQGNLIGISERGEPLGNEHGVLIRGNHNTIGAATVWEESVANRLAFNAKTAVSVLEGTGNRIYSNLMYDNEILGINLHSPKDSSPPLTPNDRQLDEDEGPNGLQNYPVIRHVTTTPSENRTRIRGYLESAPDQLYHLQFFSSRVPFPPEKAEAEEVLSISVFEPCAFRYDLPHPDLVRTNDFGRAYFCFEYPQSLPKGRSITATATEEPGGNTSELSVAVEVKLDTDGDGMPDWSELVAWTKSGLVWFDDAQVTMSVADGNRFREVSIEGHDLADPTRIPASVLEASSGSNAEQDRISGRWYSYIVELNSGDSGLEFVQPKSSDSVTVTFVYENEVKADSFYNFGQTPDNATPHWYEFLYDGSTGAELLEDRILVHFVDGQRGDHDLTVNGKIVTFGAPVLLADVLYFPFFESGPGDFTGFAVSNYSTQDLQMRWMTFAQDGKLLVVPDNPSYDSLETETQLARLGSQIFGMEGSGPASGWVQLTTTSPKVGSFFQFGTGVLSQLDGSVALGQTATHLYFTRALEGTAAYLGQAVKTWINLANPSPDPVDLTLTLHSQAAGGGTQQVQVLEADRTLPAKGFLQESITELFGEVEISEGYVEAEVTAGDGVIGFERIQLQDRETVMGFNAVAGNEATAMYSAQFASAPNLFTHLNLLNTASEDRMATITAVGATGLNVGAPVQVTLTPGEPYGQDAGSLFGADFVGSLRVETDGEGVIGDVIFGDPVNFEFAAALPLQSETFQRAIFSQVANVPGFFTGIALYNPGLVTASVEVIVVAADGSETGRETRTLEPGHRMSELVPQIVPDSDGQAGGYIMISSDQPLIAQQLFGALGDTGIKLMSAVPPTVIE